jgi:hypothetical protein
VEIAAEVAVLKREVRGYENLVITAWPENCTVVAYAEGYGFASAVKGITYVFDEGQFAHRFGLSSHEPELSINGCKQDAGGVAKLALLCYVPAMRWG